jgi:hypothetical protein
MIRWLEATEDRWVEEDEGMIKNISLDTTLEDVEIPEETPIEKPEETKNTEGWDSHENDLIKHDVGIEHTTVNLVKPVLVVEDSKINSTSAEETTDKPIENVNPSINNVISTPLIEELPHFNEDHQNIVKNDAHTVEKEVKITQPPPVIKPIIDPNEPKNPYHEDYSHDDVNIREVVFNKTEHVPVKQKEVKPIDPSKPTIPPKPITEPVKPPSPPKPTPSVHPSSPKVPISETHEKQINLTTTPPSGHLLTKEVNFPYHPSPIEIPKQAKLVALKSNSTLPLKKHS